MRTYLAGAIGGVDLDWAFEWRGKATEYLEHHGIQVLSPIPVKIPVEERLRFVTNNGCIKGLGKYIVHKDLYMIDQADILLVEMIHDDIPYRGTICEMVEARQKEKLIVVWSEWAQDYPWIEYYATIVLPTLDDCLRFISRNMLGDDKLGTYDDRAYGDFTDCGIGIEGTLLSPGGGLDYFIS